ncbi:MAG: AI-2E family transporter [Synergistaceae bacterium]|nr:AI-2E family transporter [Synergistaceae bacterium]
MSDAHNERVTYKLKNSSAPFVALLVFLVILGCRIVWPLLPALAWAAILSFFSYPLYTFIYRRLFRGRYSYAASALNTILLLFLLVLPVIGAGIAATKELTKLYQFFVEWFPNSGEIPLRSILSMPQLKWIFSMFPDLLNLPIWSDLMSNVPGILASFVTSMSRELLGNAFKLGFNLIVVTVGTFFLAHDGSKLIQFIRDIMPLSDEGKDSFLLRSKQMLYAIFYGIIMTAGIQAALGGLGWWFVGLPNPALFAALMFLLAMLPFVGTPMVIVPGAVYLLATGDVKNAAILLGWGLLIVSSIDNLLRPIFIYEGSKSHVLLVFVGILGGLSSWGFLGIFMGPLVLSVAYFMLHLYRLMVQTPDLESDEASSPSAAGTPPVGPLGM